MRAVGFLLIVGVAFAIFMVVASWYVRRCQAAAERAIKRMEEELEIDAITPYLNRVQRENYRRVVRNYRESHDAS